MPSESLYDAIQTLIGGAATTAVAALAGRMMYHTSEVKKENRKFFGKELLWELPVAFGMGLVGEGVAGYFDLTETTAVAVIVMLAYLGPRGVEVFLERKFSSKPGS